MDERSDGRMGRMGLVYIIGTYPLLTTTFIDREITILRRWGVDLRVVAVRRPPPEIPLSREQREVQRDVAYLLPIRWPTLIAAHLHFVLRRPRRYLATLAYLLTREHPDRRSRLRSVLHFGEGVYAAYIVRGWDFLEFHAHFADRAATIAIVAGRLLGKRYSLSIHAGADIYVDPVLLREKVREARHVVTCTSHNRTHLASLVGSDQSDRITTVYHGLDLTEYEPTHALSGDVPLILAVGQLKPRKGFANLIEACARSRERGSRFRCSIVGEGPQRAELQASIDRSSLHDIVSLDGAMRHEDVIDLYHRATVFVLPCIRTPEGDVDGIPNALAEAMALQVPVISTELPAIRELVADGVNGVLVRPGDDEGLAEAITRLLDQPALREELGAEGRRTILRSFDVEANVRRFADTLWPDRLVGEAVERR